MLPRPPRVFEADQVLSGQVSLAGYPFNLIYLVPDIPTFIDKFRVGYEILPRIDVLLTAAELLETQGWQIVSVDDKGHLICLRRVNAE